ncbi:MAG: 3-deoxy-D-manno-octulosonic acid transferase [Elusimicrobia bacterium]|nr:3-deoxy-D-manno-octulosonic acid transferase [Elusimicrobiota bacterium]
MILLLYQLLFPFVAAAVLLRIALAGRGSLLREGADDLRQRLGRPREESLVFPAELLGRPLLWLHAASVGEVLAAAPLLAALKRRKDRPRILVTTSTASGREKARGLPAVDKALLAPADFYPCVSAFLARLKPSALILIETELWPMTIRLASSRGLRLGLANGRLSERAFGRYLLLRGFFKGLLMRFERAAVQTEPDRERFLSLGLEEAALLTAGNMKYDAAAAPEEARIETAGRLARLAWAGAPVWAAGSTRRGEEEIVLEAHRLAASERPTLRLILAPRHPERSDEAAALIERSGLRFIRWSALEAGAEPGWEGIDCLLLDRMGVLGSLYAWAFAAFVGGTLVPEGGHNLLEPARLGCPVLFGPHTDSIREPAEALLRSGGGNLVRTHKEIASRLSGWLDSPVRRSEAGAAARRTAEAFAGATRRTLEHLKPLLPSAAA